MIYRRFGKTELQMPVFSCGGMRYQHKWQDVEPKDIPDANQDNLEGTIRRAVEVGINHIETARGYGTSEMQLGRILPTLPREKIIVQTKVSPFAESEKFLKSFDRSMAYLKLDYVDLLGIHGINNAELLDWTIRRGGCLEAAQKIKSEGRARHIGFSTHGATDVIVKAIETDAFEYVNLHWYYIYQFNWPAVLAATERDMGVFIISPSDKGGMLYKPPQKLVDLCAPLSPMVFNDLFCLSHPQVHTLSVGASRPTDFDEHLKSLPLLEKAEATIRPIIERLEKTMIEAVGEEWFRTWHVGLPKPEESPGTMNIPIMLWLRNLALAYDMIDYGKMRYNLLGNGGHWFPGLNAAKAGDFDLRACLAQSPHAEKIPRMLTEAHQFLGGEAVKRLSTS